MDLCIYCQTNPATTVDHVPPKGLFGKPRPSNLITVPACAECNASFGDGDDYFLNIGLDWFSSETTDGAEVLATRLRSMKRPQSKTRWKPVFETLKPVEAQSPTGLYLGHSFTFTLDTKRLLKTASRIIRGLYFEVTKTALPVEVQCGAFMFADYLELHRDNPAATEFIQFIPRLAGRVIGDGTFKFRHYHNPDRKHVSLWYLEFYGQLAFVGATGTDGDVETASPASETTDRSPDCSKAPQQ